MQVINTFLTHYIYEKKNEWTVAVMLNNWSFTQYLWQMETVSTCNTDTMSCLTKTAAHIPAHSQNNTRCCHNISIQWIHQGRDSTSSFIAVNSMHQTFGSLQKSQMNSTVASLKEQKPAPNDFASTERRRLWLEPNSSRHSKSHVWMAHHLGPIHHSNKNK